MTSSSDTPRLFPVLTANRIGGTNTNYQQKCAIKNENEPNLANINNYCQVKKTGQRDVKLTEQGLTSHQTHYRSYRGRFLQVMWPNQQCQSTEGKEITRKTKLNSHTSNKAVTQLHHAADNTAFRLQQPTIRRQHHSHHNLLNSTTTCSNMRINWFVALPHRSMAKEQSVIQDIDWDAEAVLQWRHP